MCEYCEKGVIRKANDCMGGTALHHIQQVYGKYIINIYDDDVYYDIEIPAKHCIECGRKLGEGD